MKKLGIGIMTTSQKKCPIVDTWWQTETGYYDFASSFYYTNKPTYATLPLPEFNLF
jgi:acyl-coenzyme A synthetase/AMP-(fatty) acid ligase